MGAQRRIGWCLAAAFAMATVGCSGDDGPTEDKGVMDLDEQGPGTCLLIGDSIEVEVSSLPVIDCALEHTHEIYAVVTVTDKDYPVYPGAEKLDAVAQHECTIEFQPYVQSGPFDSDLFFSWLLPTIGSWNEHDDRSILCVVSRLDNGKLIDSVYHSGM